jgi:predicted small metal-binding protein
MLELLIIFHCALIVPNHEFEYDHRCEHRLVRCIKDHNRMAVEESRWTEVESEKMSLVSFKECTHGNKTERI